MMEITAAVSHLRDSSLYLMHSESCYVQLYNEGNGLFLHINFSPVPNTSVEVNGFFFFFFFFFFLEMAEFWSFLRRLRINNI